MKKAPIKLILAIDFDGTIAKRSFPKVGELIEGADRVIRRLKERGHEIIINTCRTGKYEGLAQNFLDIHNIPYDYINSNMPRLIEMYKQDCRKISADIYIDDKCLMGLPRKRSGELNWIAIYSLILKAEKRILKERQC